VKKINILHIIYKYNDNPSSVYLTYLKALDTGQFYNIVVVLQGVKPNFLFDSENITYIFYEKAKIKGARFDLIRKVIGLIRSCEIDVIISHRYKAFYVAMFVNIFCSVKKIYSVVHRIGEFKSQTRKTLANLLCRKNHTIIGVSNAVSNDLRKDLWRLSPGNILTIHNAINIADIENSLLNRNEALDVLGISKNNFIFGTIGRLVPMKGHIYLLEAFALIQDKYREALLVIIGGGRLNVIRQLYAKVDELGLNGRVVLTGKIENAARLLLSFDTFVFSSLEEPFGLVLLEAMIAKLPIISTNSGGIPEVLGNETEMVMPGNPKVLAEKMIEYMTISREERLNRGNILYQRAVTVFGNQTFKQKLVSLIVD
jgi:glycosyltransferase involved in cell wall biosynthesis